jgi:pyruvate,orthophosphate dikinase
MTVVALTAELDAGRELLGGKAWSITEMLRHQIPVPPAFTLTTDECARYFDSGRTIPQDVLKQLPDAIGRLERETGRSFGAVRGSAQHAGDDGHDPQPRDHGSGSASAGGG